jgi:hypothetical protein
VKTASTGGEEEKRQEEDDSLVLTAEAEDVELNNSKLGEEEGKEGEEEDKATFPNFCY